MRGKESIIITTEDDIVNTVKNENTNENKILFETAKNINRN